MKSKFKYIITIILFSVTISISAQGNYKEKKGIVSYISAQNVYVKFDNTEGISVGDTLYYRINEKPNPCVIVKYLSSSSAAGIKICNDDIEVGREIIAKIYESPESRKVRDVVIKDADEVKNQVEDAASLQNQNNELNPEVRGRISISSYSNLSNISKRSDNQRWRYLFSLTANNVGGIPLTLNNYITFRYRTDEWGKIKNNLGRAFRIYELSADYDLSYKTKLTFGRKNNLKVSNLGSIDGIQLHSRFGGIEAGIIVGSRPNYSDYGYNYKMFQYGFYLSRTDTLGSGTIQNTIGGFQQTNDFNTDRRFIYLQHINSSIKNIFIFASSEIDLYKRKNGNAENTFSLTSLYLSARFRPNRYFSLSGSYDARKNVVYYETFKNYADSLLESETRQGLRFSVNVRPINYMNVGLHFGYRFRNSDIESTNNYGGYINYGNIPIIKSSVTVSYNKLNTSYLNGAIAGIRLYKYLIPGLLNVGLGYKNVKYDYKMMDYSLKQNIFNIDLTFQLFTKIFLSVNYEGTYEGARTYNRIYINLTNRF